MRPPSRRQITTSTGYLWRMRSALAALFIVLLALAWWLVRESPPTPEAAPVSRTERSTAPAAAETRAPHDPPARAQRLRDGAAAREARLREITAALAAREASASKPRTGATTTEPAAARPKTAASPIEEKAAEPGPPLLDRTGNHAYLSRVLTQDLMPLVDECEALAREKHPDLAGMLVLDVEILGDEDIGGVIDSLTLAPNNQIADPELLECVRESLLSTTLPPPDQNGRDAISLSLRLGPDERTNAGK